MRKDRVIKETEQQKNRTNKDKVHRKDRMHKEKNKVQTEIRKLRLYK